MKKKIKNVNNRSWVDNCEGLTREEIEKMGYTVDEDWFVEVPDDEVSNYEIFKEINDLLKKLDDLIKKKQKEKQELIDYLKKEQDRLVRECSPIYEDGLGKTRLVNEDIYNEVSKILSKIEKE